MKKIIFNLFALLALSFGALLLNSCGDDDNDIDPGSIDSPVIENLKKGVLNGLLRENYTLSADRKYELTSAFRVDKGVTLTIPAGTKIEALSNGANVFIAVLKGGKIDIKGTPEKPVVMSSKEGKAGDWGGLTICGDAVTTKGVNSTAEVGEFLYGGNNNDDNSGSIKNLVIRGSGAQITTESQYNGLTLYAVGSKTVIENIAVINGSDDGVEFFGGTVSVKNIYLENNDDDSIDWTEGWSGTVTNAYIKHNNKGFSTALEGDKVNNKPKFVNLTAISTVGGKALQFKLQSGGIFTNLYLSGYETVIDMKDKGPLENVVIEGETAKVDGVYKKEMLDITTWNWIKASL